MKHVRESTVSHEERTARVLWAAQILYYLTNHRSHIELLQPDDADEEEGIEHSSLDAETERTEVLQEQRESIRSKFLDSIAQLLSPNRGWESVTATALREREDFVEVDVARNDCFEIIRSRPGQYACSFGGVETEYCRALTDYLFTANQPVAPCEFETIAIAYTGGRVDHWINQLRKLLTSALKDLDGSSQSRYRHLLAIRAWTSLIAILYREDIVATTFRERIVQQAYECVRSQKIQELLNMAFGAKTGSGLWHALRFLARPIMDCRMLWQIAHEHPQFRETHIFPVPPRQKISISHEYQIDISKAWARIHFGIVSDFEVKRLSVFGEQFREDCARACGLHAEIQLLMHYEDWPALTPSIPYFGCSKKACLLCEALLHALSSPIDTRGRHGICYPAWGVPPPSSVKVETALKSLENMLVSRIKTLLNDNLQRHETYFGPNVPQSTLVSTISASTTEENLQRALRVKSVKEVETASREERLILQGAALDSRPADGTRPNFEPHNVCVMCNKSSAKSCQQCHSSWYCSKTCQKSDWPSHKLLCKKFSTQTPRPSSNHKRAIFFPADEAEPKMIWLPSEHKVADDGPYEQIHVRPYLGEDKPGMGIVRIERNPVRDRNLGSGLAFFYPQKEGYAIAVFHREAFLIDGSIPNKSILTSVSTSGISPHQWCGSMVAVRELPFEKYADITLADFRHLIDYMTSYRRTDTRESSSRPEDRASTTVRGVKICCYGEEVLHGSEPFVQVDVSNDHPVRRKHFPEGSTSPISKLLRMPLRFWKYSDIDPWVDPPGWDENMCAISNQNAACLMRETDIKKSSWGWASLYWNTDLGNVLAVREDGKDLAVDDVKLMCYFARRKLQPMVEDALGIGLVHRTKQEVVDFITWENATRFVEEAAEEYASPLFDT